MKTFKKFISIILIASFVAGMGMFTSMKTEAATKIPAKITQALEEAVNENNRTIIIDQSKEKIYLFKKNCKGVWILKKTGRCIVSQKFCKKKHYVLMRNDDTDIYAWGCDKERWAYGMVVDCYEKPTTIVIHSYTERYTGKTWVKDKSRAGNNFGVAVCESLARYIWKYYTDGPAVMGI